jgi:metal-responsive CopG/Arc/MetJ family transcriptional regulator
MAKAQDAERRRVAVNVSLDARLLGRLDAVAERGALTRGELLRRLVEWALSDEETGDAILAVEAEEAYADPENQERIPWEKVKAESRALP